MIGSIAQFAEMWKQEVKWTHDVMAALTDESLGQQIDSDSRTLGRIAWHVAQTVPEMLHRTGLHVIGPEESEGVPSSAAKIAADYEIASQSALDEIEKNWTDATLREMDEMYGEQWSRGQTLTVLVLHQVHHRGQMTVLMRQAGLRVPSFYGPVREDWAQWGMQPPTV